jgi:penicillin-insensitive murein endopeptidase
MVSRIAAFVGLLLFVAGGLLVAERSSMAQTPPAPAAKAPADQAAPAAPPPSTPTQPTPPAAQPASPPSAAPAAQAPAAAAPSPASKAAAAPASPVVAAPPAKAPTPVVAAPPAAKPAPVVVEMPMPRPRPAIAVKEKEKGVPAKFLFAAKKLPSAGRSMAIGYYPRGCLQGGIELPVNGPHWEVMRLSRNRNWGHPELIQFLKRFSAAAAKATGWPGILVGDMAQPRGGPLPFGHTSHQIGLDVDIWYKPMPDRILSRKEREDISASHLVAKNGLEVNKVWTPADAAFVRTAAEQPEVERVLVNAAIKKEMCKLEGKQHYAWMSKLRPWYGHADHIHVRLKCPADSPHCRHQPAVPSGDGCAKKDLAFWFSDKVLHWKPEKPSKRPEKPSKQIMLTDLPATCKTVLNAPSKKTDLAAEGN